MSTREIGAIVGVSHTTVERDLTGTDVPDGGDDANGDGASQADAGTDVPFEPQPAAPEPAPPEPEDLSVDAPGGERHEPTGNPSPQAPII